MASITTTLTLSSKTSFFESPDKIIQAPLSALDEKTALLSQQIIGEAPQPVSCEVKKYSYQEKPKSLEVRFSSLALQRADVKAKLDFKDYLSPNEGTPTAIKPHLDLIEERGVIVAAGTERIFFDLVLCDPDKCDGLIGRDINPRVKAYIDFNVMLLRISKDRKEYADLSDNCCDSKIKEKLIANKDNMPPEIFEYYMTNFEDYANVYFGVEKTWRTSPYYKDVNYYTEDRFFEILQSYAKRGMIISTIGDINDLTIIQDQKIAAVDVSNISDYVFLNIKGGNNFHPIVIWTNLGIDYATTNYFSITNYTPLPEDKEKEINSLLDDISSSIRSQIDGTTYSSIKKIKFNNLLSRFGFDITPPLKFSSIAYSYEFLDALERTKKHCLFNIPHIGWIFVAPDLNDYCFREAQAEANLKLKQLSLENVELLIEYINNLTPELRTRFFEAFFHSWCIFDNDPEKFYAFSKIPEWSYLFPKFLKKHDSDLEFLLSLGQPWIHHKELMSEVVKYLPLCRLEEIIFSITSPMQDFIKFCYNKIDTLIKIINNYFPSESRKNFLKNCIFANFIDLYFLPDYFYMFSQITEWTILFPQFVLELKQSGQLDSLISPGGPWSNHKQLMSEVAKIVNLP